MTKLTDREVLTRMMFALETGQCCTFFACGGSERRPVPMATCARAAEVWHLRNYLERHGGWCPEHGQDLGKCHPPERREADYEIAVCFEGPSALCRCRPVTRTSRGALAEPAA